MKFMEIKGQSQPIGQLLGAIEKKRISHAYLFSGPDGVGKFLTAKAFAKILNCQNPINGDSCGECEFCRQADSGNSPQLIVVEPEGNSIKINQVRELQGRLKYKKTEDKYQLVIIREAHTMTLQGANSLLKVIEEPPEKTVFILTTSQRHSLLPTILSRCQTIKFNELSVEALNEILAAKGTAAEQARLACLLAKGSAERALELYQSGEMLALQEQVLELIDFIFEKDYLAIMELVENWEGESYSFKSIVDILAAWYRDFLVWKETRCENLLGNKEYVQYFKQYQCNVSLLVSHLELVNKSQQMLLSNVNDKNNVETLLLNLSRTA